MDSKKSVLLQGDEPIFRSAVPATGYLFKAVADSFVSASLFYDNGTNIGLGTATPTGKFNIIATTEQFRVGYDSSNYFKVTTNATGVTTFKPIGSGASFIFDGDGTGTQTVYIKNNHTDFPLVVDYTGSSLNKGAAYFRTNHATPLAQVYCEWEVAGNSSYKSNLQLNNRGGTTIGVGAGSGMDFGASASTITAPVVYGQMGMITTDVTNVTYAGYLFWKAATGAALVEKMRLYPLGLVLGTPSSAPNAASAVEVQSTTQGFRLVPMTATQASAITPAEGLMVFVSNTNGTFTSVGFWQYKSAAWAAM